MRLKVLQRFRDKYTKEIYEAGTVITVKADRGKELVADPRGLAEEIEPKRSASAPKKGRGGKK